MFLLTFVAVLPVTERLRWSCPVGIELVTLTWLGSGVAIIISWTGFVVPDDKRRVLLVRGMLSLKVGKYVCT